MKLFTRYQPDQAALYIGIGSEPPENVHLDSGLQIMIPSSEDDEGFIIINRHELLKHRQQITDELSRIFPRQRAQQLTDLTLAAPHDTSSIDIGSDEAGIIRYNLANFGANVMRAARRRRRSRIITLAGTLLGAGIGLWQTRQWQVALVYGLLAYSLIDVVASNPRQFLRHFLVYRDIRLHMIPLAAALSLTVLTVGSWLYSLSTVMRWSWLQLLSMKPTNIIAAPLDYSGKWLSVAFLSLLILMLPALAHMEEVLFRHHKLRWQQWVPASVFFGLIHITAGIPVAFGFALIISGLTFALQYQATHRRYLKHHPETPAEAPERALRASTALHTVSNTLLLGWLLIGLL